MSSSTRQRNLFAAEDFTVIYDSFRQANLKAYDYDSIRGAMVDYIQQQYPENFNDWLQSSEFVAIIETLAFLAHSLAFRIDLAGRENFLSTAERRESVLKIADLIGYTPARGMPARGLLKIVNIKTSQDVYDINGATLKNVMIPFNNDNNSYQNFLLVMNELLPDLNKFGRPVNSTTIGNIKYDLYGTNIVTPNDVVYNVNGLINGQRSPFEIHSIEIDDLTNKIKESIPDMNSTFKMVFSNDSQGIGSKDTGFFVGFKQGSLQHTDIDANAAIPNLIVDVASANVNNTDVWVQNINSTGAVQSTWTQVDSSFGASTTFNNIKQGNSQLYTVKTVDNDNVNILFGDGVFSDVPRGVIRIWFRSGIDQSYTLNISDLGTVSFNYDYSAADGNIYTATFEVELQAPVNNSSAKESAASIKQNSGRAFAAQDRMITADDYSSYPLTVSNNVQKIKAINRTHSGHSRFIKHNDPTAQYQNVEMLSRDGYLYSDPKLYRTTLNLPTTLSNEQIFEKFIDEAILNPEIINLFYSKYSAVNVPFTSTQVSYEWQQVTNGYRGSTGYMTRNGVIERAGGNAITNLQYARPGSVIEFIESPYVDGVSNATLLTGGVGYVDIPTVTVLGAGTGATATASISNGVVTAVTILNPGTGYTDSVTILISGGGGQGATATAMATVAPRTWARVIDIAFDGYGTLDLNGTPTGLNSKGHGAIVLNKIIPNTARITRIFPAYNTVFSAAEKTAIINEIAYKNTFGLRFDHMNNAWKIVNSANLPAANLDSPDNFSLTYAGNTALANLDASWILKMNYSSSNWKIISRRIRFVFGSDTTVRFYNQNNRIKFNVETNKPERDSITISSINTKPNGSVYPIGKDMVLYSYKYFTEADGHTDDHKVIVTVADIDNDQYPDDPTAFSSIVGSQTINLGPVIENDFVYTVRTATGTPVTGRESLTFIWKRVSESKHRIDPSLSNIIDIFVLSQNYNMEFRKWLANDRRVATKPAAPTEIELDSQFSSLAKKKAISDSIVFRPAQYKMLFGSLADVELQGKFKVIKVTGTTHTDNEIKVKIVAAINAFFNINNWDFGEVFYFTELSAYIHTQLQGIISSIVIIPLQQSSVFGQLFQVTPATNELFIPDITLTDIELVNTLAQATLI